jgi:hypothetical protein
MKHLITVSALLLFSLAVGGGCKRCATCHWEIKLPSGPDSLIVYDLEECGTPQEIEDWISYQDYLSIEHHQAGYRVSVVTCQ